MMVAADDCSGQVIQEVNMPIYIVAFQIVNWCIFKNQDNFKLCSNRKVSKSFQILNVFFISCLN